MTSQIGIFREGKQNSFTCYLVFSPVSQGYHSSTKANKLKALPETEGASIWHQHTAAPFWVAKSQVTAGASWVLFGAFWGQQGLNLVVQCFQSGINFVILGSERRLISPVVFCIVANFISTTIGTRGTRWARRTRGTLKFFKSKRQEAFCYKYGFQLTASMHALSY